MDFSAYSNKITIMKWEPCVFDSRPKGHGSEPNQRHWVVFLSKKNINPSLVLVQPRKTGPFITERLLMGHKESNQTNKNNHEDIQNRSRVQV